MIDELPPDSILIIDDRPDEARALLSELGNRVEVVHPEELLSSHLEVARLALVDHDLKSDDWLQRSTYPIACQPLDGIALGHLLLGHYRIPEYKHFPPTAVGILSAELDLITPGFKQVPEHLAARASGLHWAFWKTPSPIDPEEPSLTNRISLLAMAVNKLPKVWNGSGQFVDLRLLLGLDSPEASAWASIGLNQALRCRPPIHELASWSSGLAFIRWLAQLVLPYPTFLVSLDSLAVRLGVAPNWFRDQMQFDMPLAKAFRNAEYHGILSNFLGRRWWIAGIDDLLRTAGPEVPFSRFKLAHWIKSIIDNDPQLLNPDHTLVVNDRTIFSSDTAPFTECVRLQLDDWPSFAEQPWATIRQTLDVERLRTSVHPDDEESLLDDR